MKKSIKIVILSLGTLCLLLFLSFFILYLKSPIIKINGETTTYLRLNEDYKDAGVKIIGKKKSKTDDLINITSKVNKEKIGEYEVIYTYKDKKAVRKVIVIDDIKPILKLKGDNPTYVCSLSNFKEAGYEAIDNYDGDITDKVIVFTSDNKKIYEVKDSSGNKTEVIRTLIEKDIKPPIITLTNGDKVTTYIGNKYEDKYSALDNCDLDITNKVKVTGKVDTSKQGIYELLYEVEDKAGNKATATKKVTVKEKNRYSGSTIYLTFDDGPSATVTPYILDVLKKYNIKATFFIVNKKGTDSLIKRIYDEGHTLGLHSNTHNYNIYKSVETYFDDLTKIEEKVIRITGESSKIIRFPGGSSNTVSKNYKKGIMSELSKEVEKRGYSYFDWNVGSSDTTTTTSSATCRNVRNRLGSGTNIVLMHDYSAKTTNIEAVECIIKYGIEQGYSFDKITSNTKKIHHGIAN